MPARSSTFIRRHINRLYDLAMKWKDKKPALKALVPKVETVRNEVNKNWQTYQQLSIKGDKERDERDTAMDALIGWIQEWRPNILIYIPGAADNIHKIPTSGSTKDDTIRVAKDMAALLENSEGAALFREDALSALGDKLESAKKESKEATDALPLENLAREAYTASCMEANNILIPGISVARAIFGPKSAEYKQFIMRNKSEDEEVDTESMVGEE